MNTLRSVFLGALFGVFAFALFTPGPLARSKQSAVSQTAISHVQRASVSVEVSLSETNEFGDMDTSIARGSGVIFHKFGKSYVLTAAHVVEGIPFHGKVKVTQRGKEWTAIVVNADENRDVALLRIEVGYILGKSAELSNSFLPIGTHLLHVGNLVGRYPESYLEGVLAAHSRGDGEFDQTSVIAWPGSSGGGVFTSDGKLVGIITRGVGPGLNFMVPARHLLRWAQENDLEWLFQ